MRAMVSFELDGMSERATLGPGEFIGRSDMAALCVDDPRVSEAHAMVSLRGQSLKLLGLRGRFRHEGKITSEMSLRPGAACELADGLILRCVEVQLPPALPGLSVEGLPVMALMGTTTLHLTRPLRVVNGHDPGGDVIFWAVGDRWSMSIGGEPPRPVVLDEAVDVNGVVLKVVSIPIQDAAQTRTRVSMRAPLTLTCLGSRVRVEREGDASVVISGIPGKILAALLNDEPTRGWREVTAQVWPGDASLESALRRRFDAGLSRLRAKLAPLLPEGEDLVVLDGAGTVTLKLQEQDSIRRE